MRILLFEAHDTTDVKSLLQNNHISRKTLSAIKQNGALLINGQPVTVRYMMSRGDRLAVQLPLEIRSPFLVPSENHVDILYEDEDLIIVSKPAGVNTIPSQLHPHDSLIERTMHHCDMNGENVVLHAISRLDRDTSGIVTFGKHGLIHHLMTDKIDKFYTLFCRGFIKKSGNIMYPIKRSDDSIIKRQIAVDGQYARTYYECDSYSEKFNISRVKVKLYTGRTHQIRVHFSAIGHPLLGETLYADEKQMARQALHASEIQFFHPILKQDIKITDSLPEDMAKLDAMI